MKKKVNKIFISFLIIQTLLLAGCQVDQMKKKSLDFKSSPESFYKIINEKLEEVPFEEIIETALKYDVILVGEEHGNRVAHYFEMKILESIYKKLEEKKSLFLSLEIFERDIQTVVDEYQKS